MINIIIILLLIDIKISMI